MEGDAKEEKAEHYRVEISQMSPILSDTVCSTNGEATTWEFIYNRLEDEHPKIIVVKATIDSIKPSGVQFKDVDCVLNCYINYQSGSRKLMKCGALYVKDNLFLTFLSFPIFILLWGFLSLFISNMNGNPISEF